MLIRSLLFLACSALLFACGGAPSASTTAAKQAAPSTFAVGFTERTYEDASRHRPLHTLIWYPADATTIEQEDVVENVFVGHFAREAKVAANPAKFGLIVMSHGTGGGGSNLVWLAEPLARRGYVVAAVDHFGNTHGNDSPDAARALWRRPPDLHRVIDSLLADPQWGPRIDAARIGAAGFSAGGYTVIALAGGVYHVERMADHCRQHPEASDCQFTAKASPTMPDDIALASNSYEDSRVRAIFAMAPPVGLGFEANDLARVHVPVAIVAGVHDEIVPFADNAQRYASLIPGAELHSLPVGGHFVFMPLCNDIGEKYAPEVCVENDATVDRKKIHEDVIAIAIAFFEKSLR